MTLLKKVALRSCINWDDEIRYEDGAFSIPSQLPMNYTPGRFVVPVQARCAGDYKGLTTTNQSGVAVFDYDSNLNKFILTRFEPYASYWDYTLTASNSTFAMVNDTTLISLYDDSNSDADVNRSVITIASDGGITYTTPYTYAGNASCNWTSSVSKPCSGYNGNIYYGSYQSPTTDSNTGWVHRATTSTWYQMSSAINTGVSTGSYQGQPGLAVGMLGGASPNGYLVVNADNSDYETMCRFKIINCQGTPYNPGYDVSYSGKTSNTIVLPLSSTRVAVSDFTSASYIGRMSLLYTNSATSPTSLTKGAECNVPSPPAGAGFDAGDVDLTGFAKLNATNYRSKDDKALVMCYWKLLSGSTLANGDSSFYVYSPCIIESTGNTNISATIPTTDINGNSTTLLHSSTAAQYMNYAIFVVGGPSETATLFSIRNDANGVLTQQTFQL